MKINRAELEYDYVILVLQGGGALGAYQAGVFEGMSEAGYLPDWIIGVSMGAINAALIAGKTMSSPRATVKELWAAGLEDARRVVAH